MSFHLGLLGSPGAFLYPKGPSSRNLWSLVPNKGPKSLLKNQYLGCPKPQNPKPGLSGSLELGPGGSEPNRRPGSALQGLGRVKSLGLGFLGLLRVFRVLRLLRVEGLGFRV